MTASTDNIGIDHLAFSVSFDNFKFLERSNQVRFKNHKFSKFPKRAYRNIKDAEVKQTAIEDYRAEYLHILHERLHDFFDLVLGLRLSGKRGVGFHGYKDSYKILAKRAPVELGFVGFGGNQNTAYIQLSGEGCKHLFSKLTPKGLHYWLVEVLEVQLFTRVDLYHDDFDNNFGTAYAETAYEDNAFKSARGGRNPVIDIRRPRIGKQIQGDTVYIGSRKSNVFWRIYDKSLEQGIEDKIWYRNEVELKSFTTDVLLNPDEYFAGLCPFAASIKVDRGYSFKRATKRTVLDFAGRLKWAKTQVGATLHDILDAFEGDIEKSFLAVVNTEKSKWQLDDSAKKLLNSLE